jgi:hypothetical protein
MKPQTSTRATPLLKRKLPLKQLQQHKRSVVADLVELVPSLELLPWPAPVQQTAQEQQVQHQEVAVKASAHHYLHPSGSLAKRCCSSHLWTLLLLPSPPALRKRSIRRMTPTRAEEEKSLSGRTLLVVA